MSAVLLSELRKFTQTWLWIVLLAANVAFVAMIALALSFVTTADASNAVLPPVEAAQSTYSAVNGAGYVFPLLVGTLLATTEFRNKTIATSLIVQPHRTRFLLGKLVVAVPIGLMFGLVGQAAAVLAGAPVLATQGAGVQLSEPPVLTGLAMGVLTMTLWTVLGAAFGLAVRNQVAAIVVVLVFNQLVEPIARLVAAAFAPLNGLGTYLPGAAADAMIGSSFLGDLVSEDLLPRVGGVAVFVTYIALFGVVARLVTLRRDLA